MKWSSQRVRRASAAAPRVIGALFSLILTALASRSVPARPEDARFTEDSFRQLLAKNPQTGRPIDSVTELIPLLPRELRKNFTFVYDSRSPFRSSISARYPRVILFMKDARLVLTFTGDPDKPGYDLLESMSFDDAAARFTMHAYLLPAAVRSGWRPSETAMKCATCHGADSRPIFDSYPLWPGFYGSVLDTFPHDRLGAQEQKRYQAFLAGPAKTGVYRDLIFPRGSPVSPYLDPRRLRPNTVELDPRLLPFLPNARLGIALTELNRERIYRKLSAGKMFHARERQLLSQLLECEPKHLPSLGARAKLKSALERENADRLRRLGAQAPDPDKNIHKMEELNFVRELTEVDRVAAEAGVDRSDWSMALAPGSLSFFDGLLSGVHHGKSYYLKEDLILEILSHLARRDPAFRRYFATQSVFADQGYPFGTLIEIGKALRSCRALERS